MFVPNSAHVPFIHTYVHAILLSYLHCAPFSASIWSLYLSRATCRLVMESGASTAAKMQVCLGLLGFGVLTIWKFILNELPPLSPPILIHISLGGMSPSCHVSRLSLWFKHVMVCVHMHSCVLMSLLIYLL